VYECAEISAEKRKTLSSKCSLESTHLRSMSFWSTRFVYCAIIVIRISVKKYYCFCIDALDMCDILLASKLRISSCFVTVDIKTVRHYV